MQTLQQTAIAAYQALELRDYGRVDMRLQPDGRVHVIEVNPNPWLSSRAEFAMAARKSGRTYSQLVEEIVELATSEPRSLIVFHRYSVRVWPSALVKVSTTSGSQSPIAKLCETMRAPGRSCAHQDRPERDVLSASR